MTRNEALNILVDTARNLYSTARNGFINLEDGTKIDAQPLLEAIEVAEDWVIPIEDYMNLRDHYL